jgi:hypothetical protein
MITKIKNIIANIASIKSIGYYLMAWWNSGSATKK